MSSSIILIIVAICKSTDFVLGTCALPTLSSFTWVGPPGRLPPPACLMQFCIFFATVAQLIAIPACLAGPGAGGGTSGRGGGVFCSTSQAL